jgi:hypothetical protein
MSDSSHADHHVQVIKTVLLVAEALSDGGMKPGGATAFPVAVPK